MAFSFGQSSSAPAFGAPATSQPAFGGFGAPAASAPFGAAPASSGGFSFGGAAAAPAPASGGAFGFGAASTPAFGAAAPAGGGGAFSFGGGAAPAFGAAASSGTSLFGAASAPAFGASSGSPFGGGGGSLFGAPATGALTVAGPSLGAFGAPPAAPAAASIFGAAAAAPAPGATTQLAPVALSGAGASAAGPDAARELQEIANCYTPGHSAYKFSCLFLSVVRPEQRARPANVDELSWKRALKDAGGEDNPEGLWPLQANGFGDLLKRAQAQVQATEENKQRLSALRDMAHKLARKQEGEIRSRIRKLLAKHLELSQRLLSVARYVDGLEGRLAMYQGVRGDVSREREALIGRTLDAVEGELSLASAGGLQRRADVVAAAVRLRASGGGGGADGGGGMGGGGGGVGLDGASLEQLFAVLKDHADALQRLQDVMRRDVLDASVLKGGSRDQTAPAGLSTATFEAA